jgi:hypothetical protein
MVKIGLKINQQGQVGFNNYVHIMLLLIFQGMLFYI